MDGTYIERINEAITNNKMDEAHSILDDACTDIGNTVIDAVNRYNAADFPIVAAVLIDLARYISEELGDGAQKLTNHIAKLLAEAGDENGGG